MGKKTKVEEKLGGETAGETGAAAEANAAVEKAKAAAKSRGPRGVSEDAKITLIAQANPKRPGSKAHAAFGNYVDGMTVKAFADAVGAEATGHLVYDSKHGFISIEGYDPGAIIVPKVREPKAPKTPKVKGQGQSAEGDAQAQAEANAEKME